MKRFIITAICMALLSVSANATDNNYKYFKKGVFISVDFAAGAAFNERTADRDRNSSSGTDIAVG